MPDTHKTFSDYWWLWLLLPFASLAGGLMAQGLYMIFLKVIFFHSVYQGTLFERYILHPVAWAIYGYVFSWIAYILAPNGRLVAAAILSTILSMTYLFLLAVSWAFQHDTTEESLLATLNIVLMISGSTLAIIMANKASSH